MKTPLLANLEAAMQAWMNSVCEWEEWPDSLVYGELAEDMAAAAAVVFDACAKGQKYAAEQDE